MTGRPTPGVGMRERGGKPSSGTPKDKRKKGRGRKPGPKPKGRR